MCDLDLELLLKPINLFSKLLGFGVLLFTLRYHCVDLGLLFLKGLDLVLLLLALVRVLLVVLGCLLLLEHDLVLVELRELANDLRHEQAHLDLSLARPVFRAIILIDICDLGQSLRHTVFDLVFLGLDVVIRVVLEASYLLLLDGGDALVAVLFDEIDLAGELFLTVELFG